MNLKGLLIRIGVDHTYGEWNAPVDLVYLLTLGNFYRPQAGVHRSSVGMCAMEQTCVPYRADTRIDLMV